MKLCAKVRFGIWIIMIDVWRKEKQVSKIRTAKVKIRNHENGGY